MTAIGAVGFLSGAILLGCLLIARRPVARGGVLVRRLVRMMVRLHLWLGVACAGALLALPVSPHLHVVAGGGAVALLSLLALLRWRALLNRGGEARWDLPMRLWMVASLAALGTHIHLGVSGWLFVGLIAVHVGRLWRVRRIVRDGMVPVRLSRQRWPRWHAALAREAEGKRIRRFGGRWRIPPF